MGGFDKNNKEKRTHISLNEEEADLIKMLIEKEGLSASDIHQLTGMPTGSVGSFSRQHQLTPSKIPRGGPGSAHNIQKARAIALVKERHPELLEQLRRKYSGTE
jgi:hypothetical protein